MWDEVLGKKGEGVGGVKLSTHLQHLRESVAERIMRNESLCALTD